MLAQLDRIEDHRRHGVGLVEGLLPAGVFDRLMADLTAAGAFDFSGAGAGNSPSLLQASRPVRELAFSESFLRLTGAWIGRPTFPVKAFVLDKTVAANWSLSWHQDLKIAVDRIDDIEGFSKWSLEAGVPHVQPPVSVLQGVIKVRIHLDDCREENGATVFIPGSHTAGVLSKSQIDDMARSRSPYVCEAARGSISVFQSLVAHLSPPSTSSHGRRILQIDYASSSLPSGLRWHE